MMKQSRSQIGTYFGTREGFRLSMTTALVDTSANFSHTHYLLPG